MKKIQLFFVMLLVSCLTVTAQSLDVTGKVTYADDGSPVIGAAIKVKGSTAVIGMTSSTGTYSVTIPAGAQKALEISYTGLKTVTVNVTQSGNYDVQMEEDAASVGDIVVTGYGTPKRAGTVVGSSVKVDGAKIASRPGGGALDALQGQVSGLQIYTSTGEPGQMQTVRLHGVGSINAATAPLYVVDGVPVSASTVLMINPNDQESVTVLKDASATSIYGSRAANGVVYITTKRGTVGGKARVTAEYQTGISTLANRKFYDRMMSTDQLFDFWAESGIKSSSQMNSLKSSLVANKYVSPDGSFWNTKWIDYMSPDGITNQLNFSIQGGGKAVSYYLSASSSKEQGTTIGSHFDRIAIRSNIEAQVNSWMKTGFYLNLSSSKSRFNSSYGNAYTSGGVSWMLPPYFSYMDNQGNVPDLVPGIDDFINPYVVSRENHTDNKRYGLAGTAFIEIEPIKSLKFRSTVGLDGILGWNFSLRTPNFPGEENNGGSARQANKTMNTSITNTIEYAFSVNTKNNFVVLLGHEGINNRFDGFRAAALGGIEDPRLVHLQFGDQKQFGVSSGDSASRFLSFFARADYSYDNRFFFDASVRNDASSRFGKNNRNAIFWAVGGMWNLKKENFLKDVASISALSFKVSYGTQGNSEIGDYDSWALVSSTIYAGETAWFMNRNAPGNDALTWESQNKLTIAANGVFWNKLSVGLEFYNRVTKDMLMSAPVPFTTGYESMMQNIGSLRNTGVDVDLRYNILRGKDYFLDVSAAFNYNSEVVLKLFEGRKEWYVANQATGMVVGKPRVYYAPIHAGIDPADGKTLWYVPNPEDKSITTTDASNVTKNYSGDLVQNTGRLLNSPIAGGFGIQGSWKGIGLQMDFAYNIGKYLYINDSFFSENPTAFSDSNTSKLVLDYWKKPGDVAKYPDWRSGQQLQFDTFMLNNASFMRLKNLTISYDFSSELMKKTKFLEGAKIYVTARNLFTIQRSDFHGIDPENPSNITLGGAINSRQFAAGVRLTF